MEDATHIYSFYPTYKVILIGVLIVVVIPLVGVRLKTGSLWTIGTPIVFTVAIYVLWQFLSENKVQIVNDNLTLSSAMYSFSTPTSTLDLGASQIVSDYETAWRVNGIALLGFNAGHFKNKAGEPVFLLTSEAPYAIIPVTEGKKRYVVVSIGTAENLERIKSLAQ